ncbi:hypothetical protein B566_EDAN009467 [Ephemera danica]|nr:hypothetical protein B566_EDAN009467 [Ephemera danica]
MRVESVPGKSCAALIKRVEWCNPFMLPTVVVTNGQQGQQGSPGQQGQQGSPGQQGQQGSPGQQGDSEDDGIIPPGPNMKPNLMIFRYDKNNPPIFAKTPKKIIRGEETLENADEK